MDERAAAPKRPPVTVPTEPSFWELSAFEKGINVLSRPLNMVASAADAIVKGQNPFREASRALLNERNTTFGDVLKSAGMQPGIARGAMGFAMDVLADPLTYVGVGPVKAAGSAVIKGVKTPITAAGKATRGALVAEKTAQSERIVGKLAAREAKKAAADPGGVRAAMAQAFEPGATAHSGAVSYREMVPDLVTPATPQKLHPRIEALMRRAAPEEKALVRPAKEGAKPLSTPQEVLGRTYGGKAFERATGAETRLPTGGATIRPDATKLTAPLAAKVPKERLVAENALQFAGIPILKGATATKAVNALGTTYRKGEALPVVGPVLRGARQAAEATGKFVKGVFSTKTGFPELDAAAARMRDVGHIRNVESGDWWAKVAQRAENLIPKNISSKEREVRRGIIDRELAQFIEGTYQTVRRLEPEDQAASLEAAIQHLMHKLEGLADAEAPAVIAEKAGAAEITQLRKASETLPGERGIEATTGPAGEAAVAATATKMAKAETAEARRALREGGSLKERVKQYTGKNRGIQWPDETGKKNREELTTSGIDRDLISAVGKGENADEVARAMGFDYAEDLLAALVKEKKGRAAAKQAIDPETLKPRAAEHVFSEAAAKEAARIETEIQRVTKQIDEARLLRGATKGEVAKLESELAKHRSALAKLSPKVIEKVERVPYEPLDQRIRSIGEDVKKRFAEMLGEEKRILSLPPEERRFYLPHFLKPEIEKALIPIIRQDAKRILKDEFQQGIPAAMRRTQEGGVLDITLDDLAGTGLVDPAKARKLLEDRGIYLSGSDLLIFEADPIKAGLKRELAHNRAITAAEMADEILTSPTFVKSRGDIADLGDFRRLREIAEQHPDHAIYVPGKTYVDNFLTPGQKEAVRAGAPGAKTGATNTLMQELSKDELDDLFSAMRRGERGAKRIDAYVIPRAVAEHLGRAYKFAETPESMQPFLRMFDKVQGWWKTFSTVPRVGFHVRNELSNLYQNALAGLVTPQPYMAAMLIQRHQGAKLAKIGQYTGDQVETLAKQLGVMKTGFVGSDVGEFIERQVRPSKNWLSPTGPPARLGTKVGNAIEDNARLALFIDGLEKGMDAQSAALRVKKYLFDYADLTQTERSVFRRLAPFYTWTRKSIPLALETMVTKPGLAAGLGAARAEAEKNIEGLEREYVADYISKSFGIPFRKNDKGEIEYFLLKGWVPTVDLAKLDAQELVGMLSPIIKTPLEFGFNTDFYKMKPVANFPTEMREFMGVPMPAHLAQVLRNVILMQQLDREIFGENATVLRGVAGELGLRAQMQDPVAQMRRYVLTSQVEMGDLKRQAEKARAAGRDVVAGQLEARMALITARRDRAKELLLERDPDALRTSERKAKGSQTIGGIKRSASLEALMKGRP